MLCRSLCFVDNVLALVVCRAWYMEIIAKINMQKIHCDSLKFANWNLSFGLFVAVAVVANRRFVVVVSVCLFRILFATFRHSFVNCLRFRSHRWTFSSTFNLTTYKKKLLHCGHSIRSFVFFSYRWSICSVFFSRKVQLKITYRLVWSDRKKAQLNGALITGSLHTSDHTYWHWNTGL